jgi:hypothetical protein
LSQNPGSFIFRQGISTIAEPDWYLDYLCAEASEHSFTGSQDLLNPGTEKLLDDRNFVSGHLTFQQHQTLWGRG